MLSRLQVINVLHIETYIRRFRFHIYIYILSYIPILVQERIQGYGNPPKKEGGEFFMYMLKKVSINILFLMTFFSFTKSGSGTLIYSTKLMRRKSPRKGPLDPM